jgi:hypothetical protein
MDAPEGDRGDITILQILFSDLTIVRSQLVICRPVGLNYPLHIGVRQLPKVGLSQAEQGVVFVAQPRYSHDRNR